MKLSDYDKYVPESFKITVDLRHANMDQVDQIINIFSYFYNLLKEKFGAFKHLLNHHACSVLNLHHAVELKCQVLWCANV